MGRTGGRRGARGDGRDLACVGIRVAVDVRGVVAGGSGGVVVLWLWVVLLSLLMVLRCDAGVSLLLWVLLVLLSLLLLLLLLLLLFAAFIVSVLVLVTVVVLCLRGVVTDGDDDGINEGDNDSENYNVPEAPVHFICMADDGSDVRGIVIACRMISTVLAV